MRLFETASDEKVVSVGIIRDADDEDDSEPEMGAEAAPDAGSDVPADSGEAESTTPDASSME